MYKLNLKLWSINTVYAADAVRFYKDGIYYGIELFAKPGSYGETIDVWRGIKEKYNIPFVIHAPHYYTGLNFAKKEDFEKNKPLVEEALKFKNALGAQFIIFHPGACGDINETVRQLNIFKIPGLLIENKPKLAYENDNLICNGFTTKDIALIMEETGAGFCLDFGHAMASAVSQGKDPYEYTDEFITLKPALYHLCDGEEKSQMDSHLHLGAGDYKIKRLLKNVPADALITLETEKKFKDNLSDFPADIDYLIKLKTKHTTNF